MHFFVVKLLSIAAMTYSYVYHLRNLFVTHTANKLQHATAARARGARPHCHLQSLFQRIPANTRISFILPETKVPELHRRCYIVGLPSVCI